MSLSEQAEGIVSWQLGSNRDQGRGKGTLFPFEKGGNSWSWHQPSSFSLYCSRLNRKFQLMGPSPYNCQEAVAFRGCYWNFTLLCAWRLMNAALRRKNPKQCSFLCLIYVNHESFHKWNERYCERLVLPCRAHPGSPAQSIPYLTASARTEEHASRHFFFYWAPTFLLIASMPYGATVHTLPETSS